MLVQDLKITVIHFFREMKTVQYTAITAIDCKYGYVFDMQRLKPEFN